MSDPARPESPAAAAFGELEHLVRNLGEELATFRKRAHQAEARLKSLGASPAGDASAEERMAELQAENERLKARLTDAAERTRATLERVRFLRQQTAVGGDA
ncbi:MAG: hypothetical protein OEW77_12775 [Gemmatimonadota bacterium]|nr:hypothetical protein [Gemmatimonadota bacterium]